MCVCIRVLIGISMQDGDEVIESMRKFHNKELNNFHASRNKKMRL